MIIVFREIVHKIVFIDKDSRYTTQAGEVLLRTPLMSGKQEIHSTIDEEVATPCIRRDTQAMSEDGTTVKLLRYELI